MSENKEKKVTLKDVRKKAMDFHKQSFIVANFMKRNNFVICEENLIKSAADIEIEELKKEKLFRELEALKEEYLKN